MDPAGDHPRDRRPGADDLEDAVDLEDFEDLEDDLGDALGADLEIAISPS